MPPADAWLSQLKHQPGLWTKFIPLAFHVDYWDYIGWKDPFAKAQYSMRQYRYYQTEQLRSVYTPDILLNGDEWRGWRRKTQPELAELLEAGELTIQTTKSTVNAEYLTHQPRNQSLVLNIAILGFDMTSTITAGENRGRTLNHDFVVLSHKSYAMQPQQSGFKTGHITLPELPSQTTQKAIVAWVSSPANPSPLQATGGWLN